MKIKPPANQAEREQNAKRSLLIVNGAGGVGSLAIQLAKNVLSIGEVWATASRKETRDWCFALGADGVIDHSKPWDQEFKARSLQVLAAISLARFVCAERLAVCAAVRLRADQQRAVVGVRCSGYDLRAVCQGAL